MFQQDRSGRSVQSALERAGCRRGGLDGLLQQSRERWRGPHAGSRRENDKWGQVMRFRMAFVGR